MIRPGIKGSEEKNVDKKEYKKKKKIKHKKILCINVLQCLPNSNIRDHSASIEKRRSDVVHNYRLNKQEQLFFLILK